MITVQIGNLTLSFDPMAPFAPLLIAFIQDLLNDELARASEIDYQI